MKYLRLLLLPFSILYGIGVVFRNLMFEIGIFKTRKFFIPVITVGNLDVGGAGKSPMTEYLIRLLKGKYNLATLSRGYGRKTKGYVNSKGMVFKTKVTMAEKIGDEPAQFRQKFPEITVAVCEDRVVGIKQLKGEHNLIILDDAFQHRAVKGSISILMFDYTKIDEFHLVLPAGNLREPFAGRKRANIMVVSKCPSDLSPEERDHILKRIRPNINQKVYFTCIDYKELIHMDGSPAETLITKETTVFLLTGIANPYPLVKYIENRAGEIIHHNYPDHHNFTLKNIAKLADEFSASGAKHKVVITTEKDAQRLAVHELSHYVERLDILVLPIGIDFLNNSKRQFDQLITSNVREYTQYHKLH